MRLVSLPAPALALAATALAAALSLPACDRTRSGRAVGPTPVDGVTVVESNVLRRDYVGSDDCAYCHREIHERWAASPMRQMTRVAGEADIRAPFDGAVFSFKGDEAVMETIDGERFVRLRTAREGERLYRVTRVIGGRYREDFVAVDVTGADDPAAAPGQGEERVMPVSYVFSTESWRYKGYSVMIPERPYLRVGTVWRRSCIFCHNTAPYLSTVFDDLYGEGAPSYQGSVSDRLLPPSRNWMIEVRDARGLADAVAAEIALLGETPPERPTLRELFGRAILATRERFGAEHLIEIGIGCESCHGGSAVHAFEPSVRPSYQVRSPLVRVSGQGGEPWSRAEAINRTCARCHTVLFSRYPHTWEGGERRRDPGGSNINSGEGRDFLLGGCSRQMSCTACHDPHSHDSQDDLARLETVAGNQVCVDCHPALADRDALAAHTRHDPDGAGSACVACHMPRKNMGLNYELTRYHRIGSPTDAVRVERDRPLECALCHPDATVGALVDTMEQWWGRSYDRDALRALYGDELDVNAMLATIERGKPHEQVVAVATLGQARARWALAAIVGQLDHPMPLLRHYAHHAAQLVADRSLELDLDAERRVIRGRAHLWLQSVERGPAAASPSPAVEESGAPQSE
jgi:predicted CXXCH cytochrome family protein